MLRLQRLDVHGGADSLGSVMDQDETRFRIRLGKLGDHAPLLPRVRAAVHQTKGWSAGARSAKAGRGASPALTQTTRRGASRPAPAFQRQVVVKMHFARHGAARGRPLRTQIAYLARERGAPGEAVSVSPPDMRDAGQSLQHALFYDGGETGLDAQTLTRTWRGDAGHFRFIVSPEDGAVMGDLKPFIREIMEGLETRLETRLDWLAVNHWDTDNPHAHVLVRGVRDTGEDLDIPAPVGRSFVRRLAQDIATRVLGPRIEADIIAARAREVSRMGPTALDRGVIANLDERGASRALHPDLIARLERLEGWGLASRNDAGWRIADGLLGKLRSLEARAEVEAIAAPYRRPGEHLPLLEADGGRALEGELVHVGPGDDFFHDSLLAIVETGAGELRFVRVRHADDLARLAHARPGALVTLAPRAPEISPVDVAIARIAGRRAGLYSPSLHQDEEPSAGRRLIAAGLRRLEAMHRAGLIERTREGMFIVGFAHGERALAFEAQRVSRFPVTLAVTSYWGLEEQVTATGPTRLDRALAGELSAIEGQGPLARRFAQALQQRRFFLISEGLMQPDDARLSQASLGVMGLKERRDLAARLAHTRGQRVASAALGHIRGVYRGSYDLAQGRMALIDAGREAHLVPWRASLEHIDPHPVEGLLRGGGYVWSRARERGLERGL